MLVGAFLTTAATVLYAYAGSIVARRSAWTQARHPIAFFALYWYGIAGTYALATLLTLAAVVRGNPGLVLTETIWQTRIVMVLVSFFGLIYYLLAIYMGARGNQSRIVGLVAFYVLALLVVEAWIAWAVPSGALVDGWRVRLEFVRTPEGPFYLLVVFAFFVPPLAATLMYARLLRALDDSAQRYRVAVTSASLAVFFVGLLVGYANVTWYWWGLVETLLGLVSGVVIVFALRPPTRARSRYGARAFAEEADA